jgi:valyl-tRNA synthetase
MADNPSNSSPGTPQDNIDSVEVKEKSKNQLKNEAKKAAKLEKLGAKQAKLSAQASENSSRKIKEIKIVEEIPEDTTPVGEKKNTVGPMPSGYHPKYVESAWYAWWEKSGFFKPEYFPDHEAREKFVIIIPPPNVTGSLHIGHAMMGSIEDSLVRWHRMCGKSVLYLPGTDHAGIATQVVVEKKLKKEENKSRHDLGREKFIEKVWEWKEKYGHRIYDQLRRLGSSLDWDRARFTMDAGLNKSVTEAFIRMYDQGLIFRDNRLVNWCGKLKTAISDLEVESKEIDGPEMFSAFGHPPNATYPFGKIWSFAYPLEDGTGEIVIETTRPETVFADSALAVNPTDVRYKHLIGKRVIHPITDKPLTIIGDEAADPQFGTGALKISPAHDPIDFAVGKKHGLDFIVILDENNCLLKETCGEEFGGLPRYEARLKVLEKAQTKGLFRGEKPHKLVLPVCARSGDFVEPRMMPQWWLSCGDMARKSLEASESGELKIYPEMEKAKWRHWLTEIRDWCLSRQLWWGHRIPMYKVLVDGKNPQKEELWVPGKSEEDASQRASKLLNASKDCKITLEQDHDVLDTWFSSGLWPFSTMGWPDNTQDLAKYYPNTLLETGSDILFFWVARMVMMGINLTGTIPFKHIFLHSIVRDAHGRKMSKSLGNVVDPIHVIEGCSLEILHEQLDSGNLDPKEVKIAKDGQKKDFPQGIPECGTDALRFALCSYVSGQMRDVNLDISKVHSYRKFCNKIWNAFKFASGNLGEDFVPVRSQSTDELSRADCWILKKLDETAAYVNAEFASYNLMNITNAIYHFWLDSLCDVYLEALKPTFSEGDEKRKSVARNVLYHCIDQGLRLIHPFMPYLSEELWQRLSHFENEAPSLCIASFPKNPLSLFPAYSEAKAAEFDQIYEVVRNIRSTAAEKGLPRGSTISLSVSEEHALIRSEEDVMASLIKTVGILSISEVADGNDGEGFEVSAGLTATFLKKSI